ncbi:hypothetical protein Ahy_A02g009314 [Arachis hypogaea]|uniref:PB1-like domain-containing protein n=1 Tax=Arachis hypogaea TaxID=3818 RepID=A0A445EGN6_ARAHY|nr:hypothetical protein Ahy_A02g009314 [Arachis hypogaea]
METLMDIMFHHGGTFKKNEDEIVVYSPDNRTCLGDLDEDTLDVFFVRNYYKELGYDNILQCWWLPPGRSLDGGLRALTSDGELREMCFAVCFAAQNNDVVVDVYFEHGVSTPEVIAGKEVVVWVDGTCEGDLVSKKNTSEGPKADGNTSNTTTEPNPIPNANPSPINNPIPIPPETNPVTIPNPIDDNTTPNLMPAKAHETANLKANSNPKPKPKSKPNPTSIFRPNVNKKPNQKPNQKPNPRLKTKLRETTKACSTAKDKGKEKMKSKPQFLPRRITRSQAVGTYRRSANKGKGALHVDLTINGDSSDDDSSEDSSFKPIQEHSSSSEDNTSMSKPRNKKVKDMKRATYAAAKTRENIMQPDDAFVEDVSDGEVDLGFVGTPGIVEGFEALDPGAESDGANSWHSEEMKTPPNSEDELESDEESDEFPIFRNGTRFGELHLQVGIPCVHACAALARVNKRPEDFCHQLCTMEAYNKTYAHHINPLPGQSLWEKSLYTQPQAPNIRRRPGALTKKRRKDDIAGPAAPAPLRRQKLPTKRRSSPPPQSIGVDPMQGASVATSSRLHNFMKFVPTPGFKVPRKKNNS